MFKFQTYWAFFADVDSTLNNMQDVQNLPIILKNHINFYAHTRVLYRVVPLWVCFIHTIIVINLPASCQNFASVF